ncbi:acyltransferase family protein [Bizionia hallyeonensis]|uniref:Acyltransferase family protein n=1 Tax=Bizionia hallyeonensis TaxID=1123757 RepID=A0ABW0C875_9FLAO
MNKIFSLPISSNRIYGLDILRALAIIFVLIQHGKFLAPSYLHSKFDWFYLDGVSVFFVLSGFLIGDILLKTFNEANISKSILFNFWIRRWFRTLPNYFFILSVLILLNFLFREGFVLQDKLKYYFFSQNLFYPHPNFFPEAWSLSVEEWFYLLIPICLYVSIKFFKLSSSKAFLMVAFSIILGATLFRFSTFISIDTITGKEWELLFRKQVFTRMDSLMFGLIGAYFSQNYKKVWLKYKLVFFILGIMFLFFMKISEQVLLSDSWFKSIFLFSVESIGVLLLLPFFCELKSGKGVLYKILTFISLISYSLYLIHLSLVQVYIVRPISNFLFEFNLNWYLFLSIRYLAYFGISIFISFFLFKYLEIPIMNLRDKIKF